MRVTPARSLQGPFPRATKDVFRLLAAAAVLLSAVIAWAQDGENPSTGRRVALVVGNSDYRSVATLANPRNDARLVAKTLRKLGFSLVGGKEQNDLDKRTFDRVIEKFGDEIAGVDVALFYYAGHGVQVRGSNYLVPIDANPTREADVDFQFVNSDTILHQMQDAKTRLNIIVFDACRNNPFGGRGLRALGGGLAEMHAPEGTLISYATQPGSVAQDGDTGDSPFTIALVHQIQKPGNDIFRVFNQTGLEVERETNKEQQPWVSNSPIDGDFYFAGSPPEPATAGSNVVDPDVVFWQSIQTSRNAGDYRAYLQQFPNGHFAPLANSRVTMYEPAQLTANNKSPRLTVNSTPTPQAEAKRSPPASIVPSPAATQLASAEIPPGNLAAENDGNFITVGEPLGRTDADILAKRFERFGYHPTVVRSALDEARYSLRFGPYSPGQAQAVRDDLLNHWHDLTFHLLVHSKTGDLMDREAAQSALELVKNLGANPALVSHQINGQSKYQVEIGPFVTQKEAIYEAEILGQKYSDSLNCSWGNCDWQYTWSGLPPRLLCPKAGVPCKPED